MYWLFSKCHGYIIVYMSNDTVMLLLIDIWWLIIIKFIICSRELNVLKTAWMQWSKFFIVYYLFLENGL
jgi:hypothetical protein